MRRRAYVIAKFSIYMENMPPCEVALLNRAVQKIARARTGELAIIRHMKKLLPYKYHAYFTLKQPPKVTKNHE